MFCGLEGSIADQGLSRKCETPLLATAVVGGPKVLPPSVDLLIAIAVIKFSPGAKNSKS